MIKLKCHRCSIENTLRAALSPFRGSKIAIYDIDYLIEVEKRFAALIEEKKLRSDGRRIVPLFEVIPALKISETLNSDYLVLFSDRNSNYYELYKLDRISTCYSKYVDVALSGQLLCSGDILELRKTLFQLYLKEYYMKHREDLALLDDSLIMSVI